MRIALFSDTYHPQVNGVARTLKRLTDYFEERGIEYKVFVPETDNRKEYYPKVHSFTSFPFIFYPECRTAIAAKHKSMSRQARLKAEHLSWDSIFKKLEFEYREVISLSLEEVGNQRVSSL
jgi:glycosyltransferase involved in cell wall biosynthesis